MGSMTKNTVVVGVDASVEALVAARYGLRQAQARGCELLLVHAYPIPPMNTPLPGDTFTCLQEAGQALLDNVVSQLDIPPTVRVATMLEQTAPVILLQRAAESAHMIVIGQHHSSWLERLMVGSVASPLCCKAACPVVIVPRRWQPGTTDQQPVVVATDGEAAPEAALQLACEQAGLLHTSVVALHAMPVDASPAEVTAHEQHIAKLVAGCKVARPQTPITVRTVHGDPAAAISEASRGASLIVLGTPHTRRIGSWSRSVARLVLKHAECPIAVVPRREQIKKVITHAAEGGELLPS